MGTLPSQQLGLAELLADLSLVTDLGMGHEPESAMRTCLVATGLAHALSLPEAVAVEAYYTALLLHLGVPRPRTRWRWPSGTESR